MEDDILSCTLCKTIYDKPVVLPCGNTICKKDLIEFKNKPCKYCRDEHTNSIYNCPENVLIQNMIDKYKTNKIKLIKLDNKLNEFFEVNNSTVLLKKNHFSKIRDKVSSHHQDLTKRLIDKLNNTYEEFLKQIETVEKDFNYEIQSIFDQKFFEQINTLKNLGVTRIDINELNGKIDMVQVKINSLNKLKNEIKLYEFKSNEIDIDTNFSLNTIKNRNDVNIGASTSKLASFKDTTNDNDLLESDRKRSPYADKIEQSNGIYQILNDSDDDCKIIKSVKRKKDRKLKSNIDKDCYYKEKLSKFMNKIVNNVETSSGEEESKGNFGKDNDQNENNEDILIFGGNWESQLNESRTSNFDEIENE